MAATAEYHGRPIVWVEEIKQWIYVETVEIVETDYEEEKYGLLSKLIKHTLFNQLM